MPQLHDNCVCLKDMASLSQLWMSGMETSTKHSSLTILFHFSLWLSSSPQSSSTYSISSIIFVHFPDFLFIFFEILIGLSSISQYAFLCDLVLVFSYYVIINHRSSIPVINNASTWSTKDVWKNPDVFLMSKMHRMQIWKKPTIRNPRRHCGRMIYGSMSLKLISSASS